MIDPAGLQAFLEGGLSLILLAGVVALWLKLNKQEKLQNERYEKLISDYQDLLKSSVAALTTVAERLEDVKD